MSIVNVASCRLLELSSLHNKISDFVLSDCGNNFNVDKSTETWLLRNRELRGI